MVVTLAWLVLTLTAAKGTYGSSEMEPHLSEQTANPPAPFGALPSPRQVAWQDLEYCGFVHFGPNTFTNLEWGHGSEDPKVFNPTALDCRQWAKTFKAAGMKGVVLTAKHHDGFCLFPSAHSNHTVMQSSVKRDVVKELSEACKAEGLKFGVYLSPWDRNHPAYGTAEYNRVFEDTLREVLSRYGDVFEMWFDGANGEGPNGKKQVYDFPAFHKVVRELQPNAVMFSDAGPDIRWVGNEDGVAPETCWATIDRDRYVPGTPLFKELGEGKSGGTHWVPAECDVSIRPGWFYHAEEDSKVKTVDQLEYIFYRSVGHGAGMLLNVPPDRRGLIADPDIAALKALRSRLDTTFKTDLARGATVSSDVSRGTGFEASRVVDGRADTYYAAPDGALSAVLTLKLKHESEFDVIDLREFTKLGQRVTSFKVEAAFGDSWQVVASGTTIGRRKLVRVAPVKTTEVRVSVTGLACPTVSSIGLFRRQG